MGERKRAGSQKKKCQCEVHEFIDIRRTSGPYILDWAFAIRTSKPMNSMKNKFQKVGVC